jgi:hypothetical protein
MEKLVIMWMVYKKWTECQKTVKTGCKMVKRLKNFNKAHLFFVEG